MPDPTSFFGLDLTLLPFWPRPEEKTILGLDLRVASVKVVELEKQNGGLELRNSGLTEVPYELLDKHPQLEDAKADALQKLVAANNIQGRSAIVVVAGSETYIKKITLAELPKDEVADAIKWKLLEELTYPIEEALIGYYPLSKGTLTGKADYLAASINKKFYLQIQYILNKAGIRLAGITILPDALQEVFKPELSKPDAKVTALIYMGKHTTNISIFKDGEIDFNRELNLGGESITRAMSGIMISADGRIEVSRDEAERIKTEFGVPINLENFPAVGAIPLSQLQAMVRPALEKVQNEVARTFEYYKGQSGESTINKIVMTGGSSLTPHLKEFLSAGLGIPVITPEALPKLNPRLVVAYGAALSGSRRINLLPDEVKFRWKIMLNRFFRPAVSGPIFLGLLLLLLLIFWTRAVLLDFELAKTTRKLESYKSSLSRFEMIEKASAAEEKRRLAEKTFEQNRSRLPAIFEEISRVIPASATLTRLNISLNDLHLWGTAFKKGQSAESVLSGFVLGFSSSPIFDDVKLLEAARNNGYAGEALNFEITAKIGSK